MNRPFDIDQMNIAIQRQQQMKQAAILESPEMGKWELDTHPFLDSIYHTLLGKTQDASGVWQRDKNLRRIMNEKGASQYKKEVVTRVSIHMQFSHLTDDEIVNIASRAAEVYADQLEDKWMEWEVEPINSNFYSIAQGLYDLLVIMLKIARNGGMKLHRERAKNPYATMPQREETVF